jgi:flagellar FliL protein
MLIQIVVLLALTGAAAGAGLFAGGLLKGDAPAQKEAEAAHGGASAQANADPVALDAARGVIALPPVTTNLAAPHGTWVRMEMAVVFEAEPDPALADIIHQDLLAYLRTVKLHQVEGASGFQHLKADLEERARIRSEGKVRALLVRTLLFE